MYGLQCSLPHFHSFVCKFFVKFFFDHYLYIFLLHKYKSFTKRDKNLILTLPENFENNFETCSMRGNSESCSMRFYCYVCKDWIQDVPNGKYKLRKLKSIAKLLRNIIFVIVIIIFAKASATLRCTAMLL